MSGQDIDITALRSMAAMYAKAFNLDYSESTVKFVNSQILTLLADPNSGDSLEWTKLWDPYGYSRAEQELRNHGRNTRMIKTQTNIIRGAYTYLMEVIAKRFSGAWAARSSWLGGKKIGLEFTAGSSDFLDLPVFFPVGIVGADSVMLAGNPRAIPSNMLPAEVYARVSKKLARM